MAQATRPELQPKLVYDVGMHQGEDTVFYLKKGFDVVGFEAHPDLVARCRKTFASEVDAGRLRIVAGAIVPDPDVGHITFFAYDKRSRWGTIDSDLVASSTKRSEGVQEIKVPCIDFASVLRETGIPYYLKIDIEHADIHCLEALAQFEARPRYVSIEAIHGSIDRQCAQIDLLADLGYDRFKIVQQARMHRRKLPPVSQEGQNVPHDFAKGSSGPFGSDLGGSWLDRDETIAAYRKIFARNKRFTESVFWQHAATRKPIRRAVEWATGVTIPGWYDTHACHGGHSGS